VLALGAGACTSTGSSPSGSTFSVVATTTVLADLAQHVGGGRVTVTSIVPKGGEVHTFDPSPQDVVTLGSADLVVANGVGLDEWLIQLVEDAGTDAPIVELGEELPGVEYIEGDEHEEEGGDHAAEEGGHGSLNPHLWLDVMNTRAYVAKLADALAAADPEGAGIYEANATAYDEQLVELDAWIRDQIAMIPQADRKLVSFHDAFPYLARAYGLEIVGVVVDAPGQDPSAGEIADLVDAIRAAGVKAVFSEAQFSDKLVRTIADETGATVESNLYNDSLGDPPADSYIGMMRWNIERIVAALS
jgi:ABC-type Zn uptake system ZnuABC Zn-binding protein ZnuA